MCFLSVKVFFVCFGEGGAGGRARLSVFNILFFIFEINFGQSGCNRACRCRQCRDGGGGTGLRRDPPGHPLLPGAPRSYYPECAAVRVFSTAHTCAHAWPRTPLYRCTRVRTLSSAHPGVRSPARPWPCTHGCADVFGAAHVCTAIHRYTRVCPALHTHSCTSPHPPEVTELPPPPGSGEWGWGRPGHPSRLRGCARTAFPAHGGPPRVGLRSAVLAPPGEPAPVLPAVLRRCPEECGRFHQPGRPRVPAPFLRCRPHRPSCVTAGRPRAGAEGLAATNPLTPRSIPRARRGRASVSPPAAAGLFPHGFPPPRGR